MTNHRMSASRGALLLEAMIALAVLATVGSGAAWLASESTRAVARMHEEESRLRSASRFLAAVSLWPREDLDRHLGRTAQGPWWLHVEHSRPALYTLALADTTTGKLLLHGAVLRDGPDR